MDDTKYVYANSRIKVLETHLLNNNLIERLKQAIDIKEILRILDGTDYKDYFKNTTDISDFEKNLRKYLKYKFEVIEKSTKEKIFGEFFLVIYDYQNAKAFLKAKLLKDYDINDVLSYSENTDDIKKSIDTNDYRNLSKYLRDGIISAERTFKRTHDPKTIDIVLDRMYYKHRLSLAKDMKYDFVLDLIKSEIDLCNIRTFIRSQKLGFDANEFSKNIIEDGYIEISNFIKWYNGNEFLDKLYYTKYNIFIESIKEWLNTDSPTRFEKEVDNYILNILKEGKSTNFGIKPIIGYLYALIAETKNLRIIFEGIINKVPNELISERLRDMYV